MLIEQERDGELLILTVAGALDNESSSHFRDAIDDHVRGGWHRILVRLPGVNYISSAGISVLVATKKRLEQLQGKFAIADLTDEVRGVLRQTRLLEQLTCDSEQMRGSPSAGDFTRSLSSRIAREDGLDLQIYGLEQDASSQCRILGDPKPLFESSFTRENSTRVTLSENAFSIGLGGLGEGSSGGGRQFGEYLAIAGVVAQSSQSRRQRPDYSISAEEFVPQVQVLYGLICDGGFSDLIRFQPVLPGVPAKLSTIIGQCLQQAGCQSAGIVLLAESAGLLGAHLRRSPVEAVAGRAQRFEFPEVRDWLSFSPERVYSRNLALVVGVARRTAREQLPDALDNLLRPLDADGQMQGHFHAAVFPYRPLKKRTLDLRTSVREQLESGTIQDVLHLLCDDRPIGVGESEFLGGACWVSPIKDVVEEGASR